jgi:hypothetical protein
MAKLTWAQRLDRYDDLPKVTAIPERMQRKNGLGTIVIPSPFEVRDLMLRVRPAKLTSIDRLAHRIAMAHGATIGCTVTTGIFAWMVANAADEAERCVGDDVAPYWRVLKAGGELNAKYPGGLDNVMARLKAEGHVIREVKGRHVLEGYELALQAL